MPEKNQSWTEKYIGVVVEKYRINRLVGEGGMAAVFEATHELIGNKVAIKILRPELSVNKEIRERFKNEARRMASLDHPNIPRVIGFEEKPKQLSIVMEFLEGEDLNQRIKREGALGEKETIKTFEQVLSALHYAHEKGIVHRDIKPSNIYILPGGVVKILDFGIAKLFGEGEDATRTGIQIGTPVYMSPEQVKGDKSIDHRSDIYSLGVTLYCAWIGKPPYDKNTLSDFAIFNKIVFEPLPSLEDDNLFGSLILKACQKDREDRFQSCLEWLEKLKNPENITPVTKPQVILPESAETTLSPIGSGYLKPILIGLGVIIFFLFLFFKFSNGGTESSSGEPLAADTTIYAVDSAAPAQGDTYSAAVYTSDDVDKQAEYTGDSFTYNGNLHTENGAPNDNYEVRVSYVVDENGFVIDVYALTNNGYGLEEEIVAAIQRTSGAWNAAKKNGATVKCRIENTFSFPDANK